MAFLKASATQKLRRLFSMPISLIFARAAVHSSMKRILRRLRNFDAWKELNFHVKYSIAEAMTIAKWCYI